MQSDRSTVEVILLLGGFALSAQEEQERHRTIYSKCGDCRSGRCRRHQTTGGVSDLMRRWVDPKGR